MDLYEKINNHSDHHLKFIKKLQEQITENAPTTPASSATSLSQKDKEQDEEEPKFESNTHKKLLEQLQEDFNLNKQDNSEETLKITEKHLLNPDFKQLITLNNKQYASIGCYVYSKFLSSIIPGMYYEIFINPKLARKDEKYRKNIENFKSLEDLKNLCDRKLDEKKVFLAQKALYALYFNKDKWHLQDALLQTGDDKIYMMMNDEILGVNPQGIGENKIGLTLENIRELLSKTNHKNPMMNKIYKCGSNPVVKQWLKEKYEDLIITIKIFAKFYDINPITPKVVRYIIAKIYLPNVSIYLNCQKSIPDDDFITNIKDQFIGHEIIDKIILDIWKYISCLCFNIIKADKGNINQTIKKYQSRLDYGENKSRKLISKALNNVTCHIKNFQEHTPTGYYTCSAQIIGGMLIPPKFDLKSDTEKDAMIKYLKKNTSTNRLKLFLQKINVENFIKN